MPYEAIAVWFSEYPQFKPHDFCGRYMAVFQNYLNLSPIRALQDGIIGLISPFQIFGVYIHSVP